MLYIKILFGKFGKNYSGNSGRIPYRTYRTAGLVSKQFFTSILHILLPEDTDKYINSIQINNSVI